MSITISNIMLIAAALLFVSVLAAKAGSRYGIPTLVLFLGVGMLGGVDGFGIHFDSAEAVQFIGMVALSIILFSGGADTKLKDIKPIAAPGVVLATIGVLLTTAITGGFIYYMFQALAPEAGFTLTESLLLAAIMSSTDSASVFSILNSSHVGLKQNLKPTLELESGSNDPMAYLLVIILISVIESGAEFTGAVALSSCWMLVKQLVLGAVGGLAIGYATVWVVNRLRVTNEFLYPIMVLACVFFTFSLTELISGNSYLAVYIAGLVVGNCRLALKRTITTFFGGFTWLAQIIMFLSLGLLVNPHELVTPHVIEPGLFLGAFMIIVGRPLAVFISLLPFRKYTFKARVYISWVGLRGAVPIIFATYALVSPELLHARYIFNMVFFITLMSLLVQGTTVTKMAEWLGLTDEYKDREFNFDLPDEITAVTREMEVMSELLHDGDRLRDITLPPNTLVILIKRDGHYLVPTGKTRLYLRDKLLLISEEERNLTALVNEK
ncbi:MAG: potassium/proton antiporter [Bacteroidales bacterium]|nr:potassium/proton antiporter [Bacteroidales bacterium]